MLLQRFLVALILAPLALFVTYLGGTYYFIVITAVLLLAAWECTKIMQKAGYETATGVVLIGVLLFAVSSAFDRLVPTSWIITFLLLICAGYYSLRFERARAESIQDFGGTLIATLYIGWLGSYLLSMRSIPGGMWWLYLVFLIVWTTDTASYFIGKRFGTHKLSPRLSPNKTWEGYFGGILAGPLAGVGFSFLLEKLGAVVSFIPWVGGLLGLILACTIPLGDLTGSMIKRMGGVKDSSNLFPGHGGMFDRIDTLLWAIPISYFFIQYIYPTLIKL
ncbi:MAG: phosphatidate cytidylyltransferase [Anaerolineales bacterium]